MLAPVAPGQLRALLPAAAPDAPEPLQAILADFERLVPGALTHWQHPRFLNYFSAAGSFPGILAELLCAGVNVNGMQWVTSPAVTELEEVTTGWLRDAIGLPATFSGVINDTASSGTLYALTAAREAAGLDIREQGMAGHRLTLYCSEEAHSSVEKAGLVLGLGRRGVVRVAIDAEFRMDPAALGRAIATDRAEGRTPIAVVATVGTTGVTAVDPVRAIAAVCADEGLWLHVDAAYAGVAALLPSHRWVVDGCDAADSLVVNPHKWLFTPIDCSILYCRREDEMRRAFRLVPPYLDTVQDDGEARNLSDLGMALGRRFRALKLWFVIRAFGLEGLRTRIAGHIEMARQLRGWIEAEPGWEVLAPSHFSTVVFRHVPDGVTDAAAVDGHNQAVVEAVNASGEAFISHTVVRGRYAMRIAIGNLQTRLEDVRAVWDLLRKGVEPG